MDHSHSPSAWKSRRGQVGIVKAEREDHGQTIVCPKDDEETTLQRRRHKPDTTSSLKASSGAHKGVLDKGVLRCPAYSIWGGFMGREDIAEDYPPCPGRTPICVNGKFWCLSVLFPSSTNRLCTTL